MTRTDLTGRAVYVSGPMHGIIHQNKDAFDLVTSICYACGARFVVNPADLVPMFEDGKITREQCMKSDINKLLLCDMVILLPGWETSAGALLERDIALACGMEVLVFEEVNK